MENITTGQVSELIALFAKKLPLSMPKSTAQKWIENPDDFTTTISEALLPKVSISDVSGVLGDWQDFYKKFFGLTLDLSGLQIPERVEGFDRLIVISKGIHLNQVWNVHEKRDIPRWQWWTGSLEKAMQESERGQVKETYAFWVRDAVEADEDLKNLSAVEIAEQKIDTENLLERLIHGFKHFDETGKYLDVINVTLCASSRYADGSVPYVYRDSGGYVNVHRYNPQRSGAVLRARRAVR